MRHPYGIWNLFCWSLPHSLRCIMRHPYGIWNLSSHWPHSANNLLWDIPMGFETWHNQINHAYNHIMRHPYGIWNVFFGAEKYGYARGLWDIPMGFETGWWVSPVWLSWQIMRHPYGIWNQRLHHRSRSRRQIMRHPYGIWNLYVKLPPFTKQPIMRHPYGIWNVWTARTSVAPLDYETSLWDLKLQVTAHYIHRLFIMRHPYGIWNFLNVSVSMILKLLWDIPMGFET